VNPQPPVIDPHEHDTHLAHDHPDFDHRGRTTLTMLIGLILLSVALAAVAQLTLKHGMNQVTESSGVLQLNTKSLSAVISTPMVWAGLVLFGLSAFVWLAVLSRTELSFAYPFASITYVLILLFDRFWLNETVPPIRWAGVAFIAVGIVLVAQSAGNGG
jgi:drug/metabolite transporter (DMT)-like permease